MFAEQIILLNKIKTTLWTLKTLTWHSVATARASNVLPFPGGPNNSKPLAGVRNPVNNSGRKEGNITISCNACLAVSCPTISSHCTCWPPSTISSRIFCANLGSTPRSVGDFPLVATLLDAPNKKIFYTYSVRLLNKNKVPDVPGFLAGELWLPGTDNCFLTAGGVEESLWNGLTGCIGADLEPIDLGNVWLFDNGAFGVLLPGTVNFFPEAKAIILAKVCNYFIMHI